MGKAKKMYSTTKTCLWYKQYHFSLLKKIMSIYGKSEVSLWQSKASLWPEQKPFMEARLCYNRSLFMVKAKQVCITSVATLWHKRRQFMVQTKPVYDNGEARLWQKRRQFIAQAKPVYGTSDTSL